MWVSPIPFLVESREFCKLNKTPTSTCVTFLGGFLFPGTGAAEASPTKEKVQLEGVASIDVGCSTLTQFDFRAHS